MDTNICFASKIQSSYKLRSDNKCYILCLILVFIRNCQVVQLYSYPTWYVHIRLRNVHVQYTLFTCVRNEFPNIPNNSTRIICVLLGMELDTELYSLLYSVHTRTQLQGRGIRAIYSLCQVFLFLFSSCSFGPSSFFFILLQRV